MIQLTLTEALNVPCQCMFQSSFTSSMRLAYCSLQTPEKCCWPSIWMKSIILLSFLALNSFSNAFTEFSRSAISLVVSEQLKQSWFGILWMKNFVFSSICSSNLLRLASASPAASYWPACSVRKLMCEFRSLICPVISFCAVRFSASSLCRSVNLPVSCWISFSSKLSSHLLWTRNFG